MTDNQVPPSAEVTKARRLANQLLHQIVDLQRVLNKAQVEPDLSRAMDEARAALTELNSRLRSLADKTKVGHSDPALADEQMRLVEAIRVGHRNFSRQLDDVTKLISHSLLDLQFGGLRRSLDRWIERWGPDGRIASEVFETLAKKGATQSTQSIAFSDLLPPLFGFSRDDTVVGNYYYYQGLNQTQIAKVMGVSQPAIAGRLGRIDRAIAEKLLEERLLSVADVEGWESQGDSLYLGANTELRLDMVLRKSNDETNEDGYFDETVGIEFVVAMDRDSAAWIESGREERQVRTALQTLDESRFLDSSFEPLVAVYAFPDRSVGVFHLDELESPGAEKEVPFMPSINAAIERGAAVRPKTGTSFTEMRNLMDKKEGGGMVKQKKG